MTSAETLVVDGGDGNSATSEVSGVRRTFNLTTRDRRGRAKGIFGLIVADEHDANQLHDLLSSLFKGPKLNEALHGASQPRQLANLLQDALPRTPAGDIQPAVVLAVSSGSEVLVAASGATARLCRYSKELDVFESPLPSPHRDVRVARLEIEEGDQLVLLGPDDDKFLRKGEIADAANGCPTPKHTSQWLTAVMASHGHRVSEVLVVRLWSEAEADAVDSRKSPAVHPIRRRLLMIVVPLALIVALGAFVRFAVEAKSSSSTLPAAAPSQLKAHVLPSGLVTLSWNPVTGVNHYLVTFRNRSFLSSSNRIGIREALPPGARYKWTVQAGNQGKLGPASSAATLSAPLLRLPTLTVTAPKGSLSLKPHEAVQFCWRTRLLKQRFSLSVLGSKLRMHKTLTTNQLDQDRSLCYGQVLSSGGSYAWQVGASATSYRTRWYGWHHFRLYIRNQGKSGKATTKGSKT